MSRRHLISWLFTLSLLLGQASAFAHAIGHLHKSEGGVPDRVCEVCVAQANLGSAPPPAPLCLPGAAAVHLATTPISAAPTPDFHARPQARAPPPTV
ncbi:hypothetical protein [Thiobacillus denitrificans]|nr:hypothetical protein [Thiobacillus denitrificans]